MICFTLIKADEKKRSTIETAMAENIERVLERGDKLVCQTAALSCDSIKFVRKCLYNVNRNNII